MSIALHQQQALQHLLTPQMMQSVKLLQLSHQELQSAVADEIERNPFLEIDETRPATPQPHIGQARATTTSAGGSSDSVTDLAAILRVEPTLHETLEKQFDILTDDPILRAIGYHIIRALNPDGYLDDPLTLIAMQLGIEAARVEEGLALVQSLEPTGVGARDLKECLALQLRERNRLDPAMQALLENLPLVARDSFAALKKLCGVDEDDVHDMIGEIRRLDPRPGRTFDSSPMQILIPDVFVQRAAGGGWSIRINDAVLPKVLVNETYHRAISSDLSDQTSRSFINERLQAANWIAQALDQRVRTIINVTTEIVRQQSAFFRHGVEHMRPLCLREIATVLGIHESTVSRVTSNKYIATERGTFPMKFFFPAALGAKDGAGSHAADAVRHRIRQLIKQECCEKPLSDGAIATKLGTMNIRIARRTVTKYREAMNIPSSIERASGSSAHMMKAGA